MRGLIIKNGIVDNIAKFDEIPEGWIEAPDGVAIGDIDNGDGTFSRPATPEPEPPTVIEQIATLECSVTPRNLRGAALGDSFAIACIQDVEDQIAALRAEL